MKKLEELSNMWSKQSGDNPFIIDTLLNVPKCEIFDHSDFHAFYTIKSPWKSDFGVKIKFLQNIQGFIFGGRKIPHASLQNMLNMNVRNLMCTERAH